MSLPILSTNASFSSSAPAKTAPIKNEASKAGQEQGYAEGLKKGEAELAHKMQDLDRMKKDLEDDYRNVVEELEPRLVDAITDVYEHVLGIGVRI